MIPYYEEKGITIYHGDCLEIMPDLLANSVDAIITDLPYGTTACKWDVVIPFEPMWVQVKRVLKKNGVFVTTASQPFTSALIMSNPKMFKYEWIWAKSNPSNIALANKQPLKYHENICVFYKNQPTYNKQMIKRESPGIKQAQKNNYKFHNSQSEQTGLKYIEVNSNKYDKSLKNPSTILKFNSLRPNAMEFVKHPTQKPVALMEHLIKTYTNEGETVLDFCMGSGTTGVACVQTGRHFIGVELKEKYCEIAAKRLSIFKYAEQHPEKEKKGFFE